jgi:hypothetical protein
MPTHRAYEDGDERHAAWLSVAAALALDIVLGCDVEEAGAFAGFERGACPSLSLPAGETAAGTMMLHSGRVGVN